MIESMDPVPQPENGIRRWTPRIGRRLRRFGSGVFALWLIVTIGSIGYNLASRHVPNPPAGLTFVQAGDINTRYRSWGNSGSPIVLVPGAFETSDTYGTLGAELGRDHRVFALDLTGTGYSVAKSPFTAAHLATQLLDFMTAMNLTGSQSPVLVGHSSGAAVVGMAALRRPDGVAGVMFLDGDATPIPLPPLIGSLFIDPYWTTALRLVLRSDWLIRRLYDSQCGPTCPRLDKAGVQTWRRPLQQPGTAQVLKFTLRHGIPSMSSAQLADLKALPIPKSVVFGANDPQYSAATPAKVAAAIGAPAATTVPGRHLTMIASPQQVAAAIRALAGPA